MGPIHGCTYAYSEQVTEHFNSDGSITWEVIRYERFQPAPPPILAIPVWLTESVVASGTYGYNIVYTPPGTSGGESGTKWIENSSTGKRYSEEYDDKILLIVGPNAVNADDNKYVFFYWTLNVDTGERHSYLNVNGNLITLDPDERGLYAAIYEYAGVPVFIYCYALYVSNTEEIIKVVCKNYYEGSVSTIEFPSSTFIENGWFSVEDSYTRYGAASNGTNLRAAKWSETRSNVVERTRNR